ncbi:TetR/AcrR family transcriptional regulator [Geodermatophilus sp. SYSU D01186]
MHGVQESGLRERKKSDTRRRLTEAAQELVLAAGLDGVTVEQICSRAGVSLRTFFNYFESKELAVIGEEPPVGTPETRAAFLAGGPTGDLLADLLGLLDPTPLFTEVGRTGLQTAMALAEREPRLLAVHLARAASHEQEIAGLLAQRLGLPGPDTGCTALAATAQALVRSACRAWFEADDGTPLSPYLEATRTAFLATLSPAPTTSAPRPVQGAR